MSAIAGANANATLTPEQTAAAEALAAYFGSSLINAASKPNIVDWAESNYYIPETSNPIRLEPVQKTFLRFAFEHKTLKFTTIVYSTIKKSGKTAISGVVGRYFTQFSGNKAEVYFLANDKEQAKDRAHSSAETSIELSPGYDRSKRVLPDQWKLIEKETRHLPTNSLMRAIASDYEGAAGGNPTATLWTELWGMTSERMKRLWDEMTPVPTRKYSFRYVETYAGFEDESELLLDVYKVAVTLGRRVTREELEPYGGWPYADDPPFYINEAARTFAYWDQGIQARRMPWQVGPEADAYYREQETNLRPEAWQRLHLNLWVSSTQEFIPVEWYTRCKSDGPAYPKDFPVVLGVDASVSGDCTALVGVSRAIEADGSTSLTRVRTRFCSVYKPPHHGTIDYAEVERQIKEYCDTYNVVQITYDMYQMHDMTQRLVAQEIAWCKAFSQATDREVADKALYDIIRDRRLEHSGEIDPEYIRNAKAYVATTVSKTAKIDRLRIVKGGKDKPVDPIVALSMAVSENLRLNL